ncbi:MAG: HDOD domain-containing protein [Gemmatimonadales bacterium]
MNDRKRRVLFVDDEPAVLDALRDLLRRERHEWDMVFAAGGPEALAAMTLEPFDVVVCDMRMPGMDGAAVLTWVRDHLPAAARIVLSGQAGESSVARALPVAHQYLSKPCDATTLRRAVSRTCALQGLLQDESVRRVIGRASRLASPPATISALGAAIADPRAGVQEIADIIEHDPAMSAKLLQLANSAFFGAAREVTSVRQAVMYLGADVLTGLATTAHVFAAIDLDLPRGLGVDDLQRRAVRRSELAARLAGSDRETADAAAAAALLTDIGILVLGAELPAEYNQALALLDEDCSLHVAEREVLGVTHAEAGAYLLGIWGLPFRVVEGVALHHRPGAGPEGPSEVVAIVHVADELIGGPGHGGSAAIDRGALKKAGFAERLVGWEALAASLETGSGVTEPAAGA